MQGVARFVGVLTLLVFLPAGSLAYWQGWLFLAVLSLGVTLITLYFLQRDPALIMRRMAAGPRAEKEATQKTIMRLANILFLALIVVPGLDYRFGWSQASATWVLAGDALVALGLAIVFFVFRENSFASAVIEVGENQRVISSGLYRHVRHPMYVGGLLLIAGAPLALGSFWGLLVCVPVTAVIVWRLRDEERYLTEHLSGYAAYRAQTRYRLIPRVY
jgi:protein-S-isoprenylcysteine O-methyltransferase Ste14